MTTEEDGVSSVVAATLVFGLIMTMMVLWSVQTLPEWVEEREVEHQHGSVAAIDALRAGLDSLSASGDAGPVRSAVPLAPSPIPLVQRSEATGTVETDGVVTATASFTSPRIHLLDGQALATPDAAIDGVQDTHGSIDSMRMLIVALSTTSVGPMDQAWLEVQATGADGATSATARLGHLGQNNLAGCASGGLALHVTTGTTREHILLCGLSESVSDRSVDLLEPVYGFSAALARLERPYTLSFVEGATGATVEGDYAAVWSDTDGRTQTVGNGQAASFPVAQVGTTLRHNPRYQEATDQQLRWEAGGLVRVQPEGAIVIGGPAFSLDVEGTTGYLRWTMVELTGSGNAGGAGSADVVLRHLGTTTAVLDVTNATFTLDGVAGEAWRRFLEDQVLLGGATGAATVGGSGDTAVLTLGGGAVTTWRLDLRLVEAHIEVA